MSSVSTAFSFAWFSCAHERQGLAEKRAAEGGADHLTDRLARCRADLDILRDMDRIDILLWTVGNDRAGFDRAIASFARPLRSTVSSARSGGPGRADWLQGCAPSSADQ